MVTTSLQLQHRGHGRHGLVAVQLGCSYMVATGDVCGEINTCL